jgi:speckle-type POZ protein
MFDGTPSLFCITFSGISIGISIDYYACLTHWLLSNIKCISSSKPSSVRPLSIPFSMAAVNQGRYLAKTSSRCVVGSVTATHDFEVTNFSLLDGIGIGEFVSSNTFSIGGRDWSIKIYPDGSKTEHKDHVSVFLNFLKGPVVARVKFSLSLLGKNDNQREVLKEDTQHTFDCLSDWGWGKFMEKSKLKPLLQRNNDSFTVRCVMTVIKNPRTEDTSTIAVPT